MGRLLYDINTTSIEELVCFIEEIDDLFVPALSERTKIKDYASKIHQFATRFEVRDDGKLVGLIACYANMGQMAYITLVAVYPNYQSLGIASHMLLNCIDYLRMHKYENVNLSVRVENTKAIALYEKNGFVVSGTKGDQYEMTCKLERGEVLVSICCLVYNHAPFLRECFEGFVMQKTNFPVEILVHDDASTDGSQEIIKEYTAKYPTLFKPIYQKENQYSKGIGVSVTYQFPRAKGKYIALCEGDDYWTDPYKLQKQVGFLETNPDVGLVAHRLKVFNQNSGIFSEDWLGYLFENGNDKHEITLNEYFKIWANHPCTVMFRKSMYDCNDADRFSYYRDIHMFFNVMQHGRLFCFNNVSSVYRVHDNGIWSNTSYITRQRFNLITSRELYHNYPQIPLLKDAYYGTLKGYVKLYIYDGVGYDEEKKLSEELKSNSFYVEKIYLFLMMRIKQIAIKLKVWKGLLSVLRLNQKLKRKIKKYITK